MWTPQLSLTLHPHPLLRDKSSKSSLCWECCLLFSVPVALNPSFPRGGQGRGRQCFCWACGGGRGLGVPWLAAQEA